MNDKMRVTYKEKAKYYSETQGITHLPLISSYNHNYYFGEIGDLIYAKSDDDNTTDYYFVVDGYEYAVQFAYSLTSEGDKLIEYYREYGE